jgi:hypothetical protein
VPGKPKGCCFEITVSLLPTCMSVYAGDRKHHGCSQHDYITGACPRKRLHYFDLLMANPSGAYIQCNPACRGTTPLCEDSVCKCTDSSCVNGNACEAGECKCGSAPACFGTQTVEGTAGTFPYCQGSARSTCQGNTRFGSLSGASCILSGGEPINIPPDADAAAALQICASSCAALDGCYGFFTVSPSSNSPISQCRLIVSSGSVTCPGAGSVTANGYVVTVGQIKAGSTTVSCTKSVDGTSQNMTCTTKP